MTFKFLPLLALSAALSVEAVAQCNDPFNLNIGQAVVCSGRDLTLNATPYPGATYTWTGPAGSGIVPNGPASQTLSGVSAANHSGIYTVTMTLGTCTYTANVNVFVQLTPTITAVGHKTPICVDEDEVMTALSGSGIGATYDWAGPAGWTFSSSITNIAIRNSMQTAHAGTYSVIVTSTAGCASDPFTFTINVHPQVTSAFAPVIKLGCEEDSVIFTNNSVGQNTNAWVFGDGNTSTDHSPMNIYKNQGSYPVRLIVGNGVCFDTSVQLINFNHSVKADFTVSDDSICQNTQVNFTNTTVYVPAILPAYTWDFRDGTKDNTVNTSHIFDRVGEYKVKLIAIDDLGCKDSIEKLVVVDSSGYIKFDATKQELCVGENLKFAGIFSRIGNTGTVWTMGDGNIVYDRSGFDYSFDRPGTYAVTFDAHYRVCPSVSFTQNILVKPYPQIDLGPDTSICVNGKPIVIADRINSANPLAKWKWHSFVENSASAMNVRHPGSYAATVEIDGCSATDTVFVTNNCYINVPNAFTPNSDGHDDYFLPRQLLSSGVTDFRMAIFNRWGQKVFETTAADGRGWDGTFNGQPQPLGVYVYLIDVGFTNDANEHYEGNLTLLR